MERGVEIFERRICILLLKIGTLCDSGFSECIRSIFLGNIFTPRVPTGRATGGKDRDFKVPVFGASTSAHAAMMPQSSASLCQGSFGVAGIAGKIEAPTNAPDVAKSKELHLSLSERVSNAALYRAACLNIMSAVAGDK